MNYALLVGINSYKSPRIQNLQGCINDVYAVKSFLTKVFHDEIAIKTLINEQAGRINIIKEFRNHLGKAKKDELALFYFSGHGCREKSPEEFLAFQSETLHENLVCYDSITQNYDIADKELTHLVREIAGNHPRIVVILDSCHSGSGTRLKNSENLRYTHIKPHQRPIDSFLPGLYQSLEKPVPQHILLAACAPHEAARETQNISGAEWGGIFTQKLLNALSQTEPSYDISYRQLMEMTSHAMKRLLGPGVQTPSMEVSGKFNSENLFLRPYLSEKKNEVFTAGRRTNDSWELFAGYLQGICNPTTRIPLYSDINLQNYCGDGIITKINLWDSDLNLLFSPDNQRDILYVSLKHLPVFRLPVHLFSKDLTVLNEEVLSSLSNSYKYELIPGSSDSQYGLRVSNEGFQLVYTETEKNIISEPEILWSEHQGPVIRRLVRGLTQIANWEKLRNISDWNSGANKPPKEIYIKAEKVSNGRIFEQDYITIDIEDNHPTGSIISPQKYIEFKLSITHQMPFPLFVTLCYLSPYFQAEILKELEISPFESPVTLDHANLNLPVKNHPDIKQQSEQYLILGSRNPRTMIQFSEPQKLKEQLQEGNLATEFGHRGFIREIQSQNHYFWFVKRIEIKLLKTLGKVNNGLLSLFNGNLNIEGPKGFSANISIGSIAAHMAPQPPDLYIKEICKRHQLELIDFSGKNKLETVLEIHNISGRVILTDSPLHIYMVFPDQDIQEIIAITIPPRLPSSGIRFQVMGISEIDESGKHHFRIHHLPLNPHDGRDDPGKSCKLFFIPVFPENKKLVYEFINLYDRS